MIPTSTALPRRSACNAQPQGKLDGYAMRVPTPDVSVVDLVAVVFEEDHHGESQRGLKAAAEGELKGIREYTTDPVVSDRHAAQPEQLDRGAGLQR